MLKDGLISAHPVAVVHETHRVLWLASLAAVRSEELWRSQRSEGRQACTAATRRASLQEVAGVCTYLVHFSSAFDSECSSSSILTTWEYVV